MAAAAPTCNGNRRRVLAAARTEAVDLRGRRVLVADEGRTSGEGRLFVHARK